MTGTEGRSFDLAAARPEGWFDKLLEQSEDFQAAAELIGRTTLGLALIAGVRIVSLAPDRAAADRMIVEFVLPAEESPQQSGTEEFRQLVGKVLLQPIRTTPLPEVPDIEALQAYIGGRYLLQAALFDVKPLELKLEAGLAEVSLQFNDVRHVLSLEDFRDILDERVRTELAVRRSSGEMAIDLGLIPQAEVANEQGNFGATVSMLSPWLTPISMLIRTGEASELAPEAHGQLSLSLDLLGSAYAGLGDYEAANEVLRLGIQWAGDSPRAASLYLALGRASVASAKHGEAIGLLRRAITLGTEEFEAFALLAQALSARDQKLAAMVCLGRADQNGAVQDASTQELSVRLQGQLGEPWSRFAEWIEE